MRPAGSAEAAARLGRLIGVPVAQSKTKAGPDVTLLARESGGWPSGAAGCF